MGSPQEAALRHRHSNIRAIVQSLESNLSTLSPLARPDIELLISFFKDAEKIAKNEVELHQLVHGGIAVLRQARAHPERYISKAPPPPAEIHARTPSRPSLTREESIARKREDLESELQMAEARSLELKRTIEDWYLRAFLEWDRITKDVRTRWQNGQQFAIEQFGALRLQSQQFRASQDRATVPENRKFGEISEPVVSGISLKGDDTPQVPRDRPFLWSEIHTILEERIAQLDKSIRTEIKKPGGPIPSNGAERRQFLLLLEERANHWGDTAIDVYENCLRAIGRDDSYSARSSVNINSLSFFLQENLRSFLHLECGCVKERFYNHPRPDQPRTFTVVEVPHDLALQLNGIIDRVKTRVERQFMGVKVDFWANLRESLGEIRTQLPNQTPLKSVPSLVVSPSMGVTPPSVKTGQMPEAQLKSEMPAVIQASDVSPDKGKSDRQEALLKRVRSAVPGKTFRVDDAASIFEVTTRTIKNCLDDGKLDKGAKRSSVTVESIRRLLNT